MQSTTLSWPLAGKLGHRLLLMLMALCFVAACTPVGGAAEPPTATVPVVREAPSVTPTRPTATPAPAERIAFFSNRERSAALYLMNADGTDPRRITPPKQPAFDPTWSPDGRYLAFVSSQISPNALVRMTIDGTETVQLTSEKATYYFPAWSPDGNWVAFAVDRQKISGIGIVRADGSGATQMLTPADGINAVFGSPTWAPDSQSLILVATHEGETDWYRATVSGDMELITHTTSLDLAPSLSPDGQWIAFASDRDDPGPYGNTAIYLMRADGSAVQPLTVPGHIDTVPSWSPDGTRLAFVSYRDGNSEIYTINRDGTQETRLTRSPSDDYRPMWEPVTP